MNFGLVFVRVRIYASLRTDETALSAILRKDALAIILFAVLVTALCPAGNCQDGDCMPLLHAADKAQSVGKLDEAEKYLREAVRKAETLPQPDIQLAVCLVQLGGLLQLKAKNAEACQAFERATGILRTVKGGPPADVKACMLADATSGWAAALMDQGKYDLAADKAKQAIALTQNVDTDSAKVETCSSLISLAQIRLRQDKFEDCIAAATQSLHALKGVGQSEDPDALKLKSLAVLSSGYAQKGEFERAERSAEEALKLSENHPTVAKQDLADACKAMSLAYYSGNKLEKSKLWAERAISQIQRWLGQNHPLQAGDLNTLGLIAIRQNHPKDAQRYFEKALQILQGSKESDPKTVILIKNNLHKLQSNIGSH